MSDTAHQIHRVLTRHLGPVTIGALLHDLNRVTGDAAWIDMITQVRLVHQPSRVSQPWLLDVMLPPIEKTGKTEES